MALIGIVDNLSMEFVNEYQDTAPNPNKFGNDWAKPLLFTHFLLPQGDYTCYDITPVSGSPTIALNSTKLDTWKRNQNLSAQTAYTTMRSTKCDLDCDAVMAPNQDVTWLMFAADNIFTYLQALQTAAGILDSALSSDGQTAKATLLDLRTNLYGAIQALRDQRDSDIAAYTPPYGDVSPLYPV